jgi:D-apionolactonase
VSSLPESRRSPEPLPLRAGPWSAELRGEELADIRYDGRLLLRAVRPVVRDEDWNTVPATVVDRQVSRQSHTWSAVLALRFRGPDPEGPVDYDGRIEVTAEGESLTVSFAGTARTAFRRNRIGLVVLHPLAEAGRPVEVVHSDGSVVPATWPHTISPHQPFRDVRGLRWQREGVRAALDLDGDVFETEDQRNWTDASFKTYGTPLSEPFPVDLAPGDQVHQTARLHAAGRTSTGRAGPHASSAQQVVVTGDARAVVPALSLGATPRSEAAPAWARPDSGFEAVLVELTEAEPDWPAVLAAATREADSLGAALDVRVVAQQPTDVETAVELLDPSRLGRIGVFDAVDHVTTPPLWEALLKATHGVDVPLVAGARSHFAELNRRRADLPPDAPALTCSITPQMHACEIAHVVESLAGQEAVARDAVRLAGDRPVHLGPVTLRQRFNAVATSGRRASARPDPAQPSPFTAAWTLGSLCALTRRGVESLCFYEVTGPGGIGDAERLYPVGELLTRLARLRGCEVLAARAPEGVAAYPVRTADGLRVVLARLAGTPVRYDVRGPHGSSASVALEAWSTAEVRLT